MNTRTLEQIVSLVPLALFAMALVGMRWFAMTGSLSGLLLAVVGCAGCIALVAVLIHLHYPPTHRPRWRSNSC